MELMIDLETLDTKPTSLVLSVGLLTFRPDGSSVTERTVYPSFDEQLSLGRTISLGTLRFWLDEAAKDPAAMQDTFVPEAQRVQMWAVGLAIEDMTRKSDDEVTAVWANGDLFDLGILQNIFGPGPWPYNAPRDLRTLSREAYALGWQAPEPRAGHRQHSAIDDCRYQVDVLTDIRQFLRLS